MLIAKSFRFFLRQGLSVLPVLQLQPFSDSKLPKNEVSNDLLEYSRKLFESNSRELVEMSKVFFENLETYSIQQRVDILKIYSQYDLLDERIYPRLEKSLLKIINKISADQLIDIYQSLLKICKGTDQFFLFLDYKVLNSIHTLTSDQISKLIWVLSKLNRGSLKVFNALHYLFINKLSEFTPLHMLKNMQYLLQAHKSKPQTLIDTLEVIFRNTTSNIHKLDKNTVI